MGSVWFAPSILFVVEALPAWRSPTFGWHTDSEPRRRATLCGPVPGCSTLAARVPSLAKLTRPKLFDALSRERLFSLLDEAAARRIVWICGAPGAGKTTLVASYLEARRLRHLWYQCDVGDSDAATFAHYLRIAAEQLAAKAARTLPRFTSEPQQNVAKLARLFFRELFAVLPQQCVVVFDNFHDVDMPPEQRGALAQGFEEIPDGARVIVISRADPPPEFARLVAGGRVARIDEAALHCTSDEANAILGEQRLDREQLSRIHRQTDGWMAALVLLREHCRRHRTTPDASLAEGKDAIFQYFAGEIFNGARPENRRVLMLTAIPPSITAPEAVALTGNDDAPRLLEYLYRHHLFTDRRRGEQTTYHYHALFREFLLEELANRVPQEARRAATVQAAQLLTARGQVTEALALFRDAGDWEAMRTLIHANALEWARQGRSQVLADWIEALPQQMRDSDPWLTYWFGRAWVFTKPERGRAAIEQACEAFRASGDVRGHALALSAIVNSYYYYWSELRPLDRWIPELKRLVEGDNAARLDAASELRARAALLAALLLRTPDDESIAGCAHRLHQLIDAESDPNLRVMAASILFDYLNDNTDDDASRASLVARIEPVLRDRGVTPLMHTLWGNQLSFWHYVNGRYADSTAVDKETRAIAERYGLEMYLFDVDFAEAQTLINKGDHAVARVRLDEMARTLSQARRIAWPFYYVLRSKLEQRLLNRKAAIEHADHALAVARELDLRSNMPYFLARVAQARAALCDGDGAMTAIEEAIALAPPQKRTAFERWREILAIEGDLCAGRVDSAAERLPAILADLRTRGDYVFMRSRPDLAARLANLALERGIETDYARTLIDREALVAPADVGPAWPFRLRVHVLGPFKLIRDDEAMRFSGKTQERPLDLLKLIAALGGKDIDAEHATGLLWPDSEGAAARRSFESALFRLRKLLDVEGAIPLVSGKLSLARSLVWTDVWSFEAALDHAGDESAPLAERANRVLDTYAGPLLGDEEDPWIAKPRDALRARFVRGVLEVGEQVERRRDFATAIRIYRRGLEADNLAEPFYRGLMRSLAATGDYADAVNAFRRCRELLSIVLGIKPSAETERLYREITATQRERG